MEAVILMISFSLLIGVLLLSGAYKTQAMKDEKRYVEGIRLVEAQKYLEGLAYFEQVLKRNPQSGVAWSYKAECHLYLDDLFQSIVACNKALNIDYTLRDCYLFKGVALYKLNNYEDAHTEFENAIWHFREKHPEAFKYRGLCYYQSGDYIKAEADFQQAILLGDEDAQYLLNQMQKTRSEKF